MPSKFHTIALLALIFVSSSSFSAENAADKFSFHAADSSPTSKNDEGMVWDRKGGDTKDQKYSVGVGYQATDDVKLSIDTGGSINENNISNTSVTPNSAMLSVEVKL